MCQGDAKFNDMQRYYDKLIAALEEENAKLRNETHRAETRFQEEVARLSSLYRSRETLAQTEDSAKSPGLPKQRAPM